MPGASGIFIGRTGHFARRPSSSSSSSSSRVTGKISSRPAASASSSSARRAARRGRADVHAPDVTLVPGDGTSLPAAARSRFARVSTPLTDPGSSIESCFSWGASPVSQDAAAAAAATALLPRRRNPLVESSTNVPRSASTAPSANTISAASCPMPRRARQQPESSKARPKSRLRQLYTGGWGGLRGGSGFPNCRVTDLRTGRRSRMADVCRGKVCVIDFWLTKHGSSPVVSMDA